MNSRLLRATLGEVSAQTAVVRSLIDEVEHGWLHDHREQAIRVQLVEELARLGEALLDVAAAMNEDGDSGEKSGLHAVAPH